MALESRMIVARHPTRRKGAAPLSPNFAVWTLGSRGGGGLDSSGRARKGRPHPAKKHHVYTHVCRGKTSLDRSEIERAEWFVSI